MVLLFVRMVFCTYGFLYASFRFLYASFFFLLVRIVLCFVRMVSNHSMILQGTLTSTCVTYLATNGTPRGRREEVRTSKAL